GTKCLETREKWTRPGGTVDLLTNPRDIFRRALPHICKKSDQSSLRNSSDGTRNLEQGTSNFKLDPAPRQSRSQRSVGTCRTAGWRRFDRPPSKPRDHERGRPDCRRHKSIAPEDHLLARVQRVRRCRPLTGRE